MENALRRKYVPTEAYRLMVLAVLQHRRGASLSKGTLAAETRSSHYAVTKALSKLRSQGLVDVTGSPEAGYTIRLNQEGVRFCEKHRSYMVDALREASEQQFRYGRRPEWLDVPLSPPPPRPS